MTRNSLLLTSIDNGQPPDRRTALLLHKVPGKGVLEVPQLHGAQPRDGSVRVGPLNGYVVTLTATTSPDRAGGARKTAAAATTTTSSEATTPSPAEGQEVWNLGGRHVSPGILCLPARFYSKEEASSL